MTHEELINRVQALQLRVTELESRSGSGSGTAVFRGKPILGWVVAVIVLAYAGAVIAANGNCPNGFPFCFSPNTPAKASEINHNFDQMREWTEQKVGTVGSPNVIVTGNVTVGPTTIDPTVTDVGNDTGGAIIIDQGSSSMRIDGNEIESDTGYLNLNINANRPVKIGGTLIGDAGGTFVGGLSVGGVLESDTNILSDGSITSEGDITSTNGNITATNGNLSADGTLTASGNLSVPNNSHGSCVWSARFSEENPTQTVGGYDYGYAGCPSGYFVAGAGCNGGNCDNVILRCCLL